MSFLGSVLLELSRYLSGLLDSGGQEHLLEHTTYYLKPIWSWG